MFYFCALVWRKSFLSTSSLVFHGEVQCTFTITEAQNLFYYLYTVSTPSHCCCSNVILNIYIYIYMFNTLYTHGTNVPNIHTHMHNKMLCTSKIALLSNPVIVKAFQSSCTRLPCMLLQWREVAMHMSDELQSSPTNLWRGHKVHKCQSETLMSPQVHSVETSLFAFLWQPSSLKRRGQAELLRSKWGSGSSKRRTDGQVKQGKRFLVPFYLQRRNAGCVRHRQRRYGQGFINIMILTGYPKKPKDRFVSWRGIFCN